ncbi:PI16 inhibitor, partial [Menura novaehollandiae]|nr:PI16 inhibitor [Menura novaehollandiae]
AACTMLSSGLLPMLLVLTVLELSWSLSDEEKKIILDEHNKYRSQVPSVPLCVLTPSSFQTWDTDLEVTAQAYAEKCIWGQNGRAREGRNFFATASTLGVELAVAEWNGERKFYNLTTYKCDPGQMCGHYTQLVWANTAHIGCGTSFCEKIDGIETENLHLLVCNYFPPGNMKGKKPYVEGPSCTKCPLGTVCVNNLCGDLLVPSLKRIFSSNFMFSSLPSVSAPDTEKQQKKVDQTSVDPPKAGVPCTSLGLSLFLLPSATLVGLLL